MAKNPQRSTFADVVSQPTWSQTDAAKTGKYAPRPGGFNSAGDFFDQRGQKLRLAAEDVEPDEAQALVKAGAVVVAETCGCGGSGGDCTPEWMSPDQLRGLRRGEAPVFTGRHGAPTWIDAWSNDGGTVVFAHGDVSWGNELP